MNNETFVKLREVLAIATGHSLEEIGPTSQLADDLGVDMEDDFPRLISTINREFGLKLQIKHVLDELAETGDTVEQLAKLVEEEIELG